MKIAIFPSTFLPRIGGAEIAVHYIAKHLTHMGVHVDVFAWWGQWKDVRDKVPYTVRPFLPRSWLHCYEKLLKRGVPLHKLVSLQIAYYQNRYGYDLWNVHVAYPALMMAGPPLLKRGVPVLVTSHGGDVMKREGVFYGARTDALKEQLIRKSMHPSFLYAAISPAVKEAYLELGVAVERICSVFNGVDYKRLQIVEKNTEEIRKLLDIPNDHVMALTVGNHRPAKGFDRIPKILQILQKQQWKGCWVIVGDGCESLIKRMNEQGVGDYVRWLPQIQSDPADLSFPPQELIDLYNASDMYVMTSLMESFGLVVLEAMAAGKPVVTAPLQGCSGIVFHEKNGIVTDDSMQSFAAAIKMLSSDPVMCNQLGRAGKDIARQMDWSGVAERYFRIFSDMCQGVGSV